MTAQCGSNRHRAEMTKRVLDREDREELRRSVSETALWRGRYSDSLFTPGTQRSERGRKYEWTVRSARDGENPTVAPPIAIQYCNEVHVGDNIVYNKHPKSETGTSSTLTNTVNTSARTIAQQIQSRVTVQTRLIKDAADRLVRKAPHIVVIVGKDRQGKTSAGKEIVAIFSDSQKMSECFGSKLARSMSIRKPMLIPAPDIWSECIALVEKLVVLIDNFSINEWEHYIENIMICAKENSFIILTVNEKEYENNQAILRKYELFNKSHVFDLCSSMYLLSDDEKTSILKRHIQTAKKLQETMEFQTEFCDAVARKTPSVFFLEYIFILFSANNRSWKLDKSFFDRPLNILKGMLDSLKKSPKRIAREKFAFLCKLYLNHNTLDFGFSDYPNVKDTAMKLSMRKALLCPSSSPSTELEIELRKKINLGTAPSVNQMKRIAYSMHGVFVHFEDDTCKFLSVAVQMAIAVMFLEEFPGQILAFADYELVHTCFRPIHSSEAITEEGENFLTYDVTPEMYECVSGIFERAIINGSVERVLRHPLFKEQDFVDLFFKHCKPNVLFSRDFRSGNSVLYHAVDVPNVDMVGNILANKNWKGLKRKPNKLFIKLTKKTRKDGVQTRETFVREQNYKSLLKACKHGKTRDVKALTRSGTPVTQSCLVDASISGKIDIVRHIHGCQTNWSATRISQALFEACKSFSDERRTTDWGEIDYVGIPDVITFLRGAGGDPNIDLPGIGLPIRHAIETKDRPLLELLIAIGGDVNCTDSSSKNMLHFLLEDGFDPSVANILMTNRIDLDWQDVTGLAPLHIAVFQNRVEAVSLFLDYGANVNLEDDNKNTPVILASDLGYLPVVELLVDHGAETTHRDILNETAVSKAISKRHTDIVTYFASKNIVDEDGLFQLVLANDIELMNIFCSAEFNVNFHRDDGTSLLQTAVYEGLNDMVSLLFKRGADPNILVQDNYSLTLYPIKTGNLKLFKLLCRAGSDIAVMDRVGNSALHICCALGNVEFVDYIMDTQQSLIHSLNKLGWNPLEYAAYCGRFDLIVKLSKFIHRKFRSKREKICCNLYRRAVEGYNFYRGAGEGYDLIWRRFEGLKLRSEPVCLFVETEVCFGSVSEYMKIFDYL